MKFHQNCEIWSDLSNLVWFGQFSEAEFRRALNFITVTDSVLIVCQSAMVGIELLGQLKKMRLHSSEKHRNWLTKYVDSPFMMIHNR